MHISENVTRYSDSLLWKVTHYRNVAILTDAACDTRCSARKSIKTHLLNWLNYQTHLRHARDTENLSIVCNGCLTHALSSNIDASISDVDDFTALHEMQTRSYDENSICPSVRLSVKRVHCDKTEERYVQIFIPYERSFILVFREEELWGTTTSTLNFGSTGYLWSEIADFEQIIARSDSSVTPCKKVQLTLIYRKSDMRFPVSNEPKMIIVRFP